MVIRIWGVVSIKWREFISHLTFSPLKTAKAVRSSVKAPETFVGVRGGNWISSREVHLERHLSRGFDNFFCWKWLMALWNSLVCASWSILPFSSKGSRYLSLSGGHQLSNVPDLQQELRDIDGFSGRTANWHWEKSSHYVFCTWIPACT